MSSQIQITGETKVKSLTGVLTGTSGVVGFLPIDVSLGIPQLDVNGKILVSQLPNSVMEYKGTWDASTNTPTLANGTGNQGDVYLCNVAGTVNFGAGAIAFFVGDQVIYSGSIWQRASGATGTVTSVAITESGDSLNITGSPITTSGTINIGFNGTNLQYVNGAGNLTTFPTLITSIGLSMPSAFSVSNSPLTANGTIAVTGAGVASQYIRGDGTLADFPSSGGGGSSVSYYLNGGTSQGTIGGTTYYEMSKTAIIGTGVDFSLAGDGFIVAFLTDANDPAQLNIPAGNWNYEIYASMSSNGGTPAMYAELYVYDGTTFTLISTSSNEIIYDGTALNLYTFAMAVPATTLALTDRLAIKLYATNSGGKTTTIHTQDGHLCQVITTFSTGITALNGLTAQVQYFQTGTSGTDFNISSTTATHTFNLPTASAANRGALSSADWSTFNGKQSALTIGNITSDNTAFLTLTGGTGAIIGSGVNIYIIPSGIVGSGLTLTTTGTSGAATFIGSTLNIPNYGSALSGYLPLTGGTLTGALGGTSATFSSSVTINGTSSVKLEMSGGTAQNGILFNAIGSAPQYYIGAGNNLLVGGDRGILLGYNVANATAALFYNSVSDAIIFGATNATERMRIASGGNVGIGTSIPIANLEVSSANSTGFFRVVSTSSGTAGSIDMYASGTGGFQAGTVGFNTGYNVNLLFNIGGTERMRITSGGNVLIGTTTSAAGVFTLQVGNGAADTRTYFNPSNAFAIAVANSGGNAYYLGVATSGAAGSFQIYSNTTGSANLTITSTGAATFSSSVTVASIYSSGLIQTPDRLYINGQTVPANWISNALAAGYNTSGQQGWIQGAGSLALGTNGVSHLTLASTGAATFSSSVTATSFFESSDSRLKTIIQDNYQTKGIASITPKLYTKNGKVELGYYAQDFVGILDSAVSKGSDDMLSLSYREVHTAKIYALEQEIKDLKAKMN